MSDDHRSPELIKDCRLNWLGSLQEFSDYSLQLHAWRGGLEPKNPHWSFREFMCSYFDDLSLSMGYDWPLNDGFVSNEERAAVVEFHQAANKYKCPLRSSVSPGQQWTHIRRIER
ncbi:MAG: hypothetical protein ABI178_04745 [Rhodanobacter sp.]